LAARSQAHSDRKSLYSDRITVPSSVIGLPSTWRAREIRHTFAEQTCKHNYLSYASSGAMGVFTYFARSRNSDDIYAHKRESVLNWHRRRVGFGCDCSTVTRHANRSAAARRSWTIRISRIVICPEIAHKHPVFKPDDCSFDVTDWDFLLSSIMALADFEDPGGFHLTYHN
jgi:hypothetical protein